MKFVCVKGYLVSDQKQVLGRKVLWPVLFMPTGVFNLKVRQCLTYSYT